MINHFILMVIYSLMISIFFGVLVRERIMEIAKLAAILFVGMAGGSLFLAWIMYPFP